MGEENKIRDAGDAVRGALEALPVYQDALQPATRELGIGLQQAVRLALTPLRLFVLTFEQLEERLGSRLAEKLRDIPPERIIHPSPSVAVPALQALSYTAISEPSLAELYENLLATAMDADTALMAHPAFAEFIRQLTPDEARLIRLLGDRARWPLWSYRFNGRTWDRDEKIEYGPVLMAEANCKHAGLLWIYIGNLQRLGLIDVPDSADFACLEELGPLSEHPLVQANASMHCEGPGEPLKPALYGQAAWITALGRQFFRACASLPGIEDDHQRGKKGIAGAE